MDVYDLEAGAPWICGASDSDGTGHATEGCSDLVQIGDSLNGGRWERNGVAVSAAYANITRRSGWRDTGEDALVCQEALP